jgi:hypothetical protein
MKPKILSLIVLTLFLSGCVKEDLELPYNQFDGIAERQVVVPDSFQYKGGDVYIYWHYNLEGIDEFSAFEKVKLYLGGYGYIGRWAYPSTNVIVHPNVPANRTLEYGLTLACTGCTETAQGKIIVSTF